ncbi:hypothetical protein [Candidatus Poriferisodalis sp.]|uniref:hypothetical protein n=1 Tax=Candidatus Poriferisodalis sp. TaxID=3101277 RepID=UPI003B01E0A6
MRTGEQYRASLADGRLTYFEANGTAGIGHVKEKISETIIPNSPADGGRERGSRQEPRGWVNLPVVAPVASRSCSQFRYQYGLTGRSGHGFACRLSL